MKRSVTILFMLLILIISVFATKQIDSAAFDITAFKEGSTPRTTINVTTGASAAFSYEYGGARRETVYDVTAAAQLRGNVEDALIVEVSTNERINVTINLSFTPFIKFLEDGSEDNSSTWKNARYISENPTIENGEIGVVENCIVKGSNYNYYSKLTTKPSFQTADRIDKTVRASDMNTANASIQLTNIIVAVDSNISVGDINTHTDISIPSGSAQTLPGIRNNMLTSRRVFMLSSVSINNFEKNKVYVSYINVTISTN